MIIFGNHNGCVGEGVYPRSRVIDFVMPTRRKALKRCGNYISARVPPPDRPLDLSIAELIATARTAAAGADSEPRGAADAGLTAARA